MEIKRFELSKLLVNKMVQRNVCTFLAAISSNLWYLKLIYFFTFKSYFFSLPDNLNIVFESCY